MGHASLETTNRYAPRTEEGERRAVEVQEKVIELKPGHKTEKAGQLTYFFFHSEVRPARLERATFCFVAKGQWEAVRTQ
jgi:hypothetical protein